MFFKPTYYICPSKTNLDKFVVKRIWFLNNIILPILYLKSWPTLHTYSWTLYELTEEFNSREAAQNCLYNYLEWGKTNDIKGRYKTLKRQMKLFHKKEKCRKVEV